MDRLVDCRRLISNVLVGNVGAVEHPIGVASSPFRIARFGTMKDFFAVKDQSDVVAECLEALSQQQWVVVCVAEDGNGKR